jgi:DNA-binding transcriptional regulator/RsmH inhibitor MraZ
VDPKEYAMLLGEYLLRVESAGWLPLPASIRNALHEIYAPDDTALILSTFFEKCICCYPVAEWYKEPERLPLLGVSSRELNAHQLKAGGFKSFRRT